LTYALGNGASVGAGTTEADIATCPAGQAPTGGGFVTDPEGEQQTNPVTEFAFDNDGNGQVDSWGVVVTNYGSTTDGVVAQAVCAAVGSAPSPTTRRAARVLGRSDFDRVLRSFKARKLAR
jgi:hypothetical protein